MSPIKGIKLDHPTCLFVTRDEEKNQFSFNLPFYPKQTLNLAISKPGRIFTFRRPGSESFADFETRLLECLNKYFGKPLLAPKESHSEYFLQVTKVALANSQLKPDDKLETIFASPDPLQILIGIETDIPRNLILDMMLNPATVKSVKLEMLPQVGCPIIPAIVGTNLDFKKSKFKWILSRNKANSEEEAIWPNEEEEKDAIVHEGYIFTPQSEHLGYMVRLRVLPYDSEGRPGQPLGNPVPPLLPSENRHKANIPRTLPFLGQLTTAPRPIEMAPAQKLIKKRITEVTERRKSSNEFRLVCYNLLANMYSRTESARKVFFRHCPAAYLDYNYRYPLIHRELLAYQGDILCLQEVDTAHFQQRLTHFLREAGGYEGCFISKVLIRASDEIQALPPVQPIETYTRKDEGVAIFYKPDRFRLIKEFKLDSLIMFAETSGDPFLKEITAKYHHLAESKEVAMYLCMRARAHGALVCLFECSRTGHRFLCANTHLYFHPQANTLKNIQCLILRNYLLKLAEDNADGKPLPIILAADLNTSPGSQPYKHLVAGSVNEDGSQQEPGLIFKAAVPLPEGVFTNMVPGFKANLDAVLYGAPSNSKEILKVAHAFSVPTESEVFAEGRGVNPKYPPILPEEEGGLTLPNSQFPSDHLPLIVDFAVE